MKDSQINMFDHSEVKIRLLKLYLEKYLNILNQSQFTDIINIYDLFCAEGIYENGGKGSPIIILETIKNIYWKNKAAKKKQSTFNCYFNDIILEKVEKLKKVIREKKLHYPEMGNLKLISKDYKVLVPRVNYYLNRNQNEKAFIFIDPYGYKDISIKDIESLLNSGNSEVLLFLPTQFMYRFEKKGTPEILKKFISELIDIDQWQDSDNGVDFIENLKDSFRNYFRGEYFIDSFIISRDKNQFFSLFFFTSHIKGFEKMLESKWEIDEEEGRGWSFEEENNLFSSTEKAANTLKYEKLLNTFLEDEKTNSEIYQFTIRNGYLTKHANQILKSLQKNDLIDVKATSGTKIRKNSFYINYINHRDNPNKITIKLK